MIGCCFCHCYDLFRGSLNNENNNSNNKNNSGMNIAPMIYNSVIYNAFIYACMPHIYMLQLIEILRSATNVPWSDIPDILIKYFARSTWTIFSFLSFNAIFEKNQRRCLTDIKRNLLPELACTRWNSIEFVFQWTTVFCLEDVEVPEIVHIFS